MATVISANATSEKFIKSVSRAKRQVTDVLPGLPNCELSESDKSLLLDGHNQKRRQEGAGNMKELVRCNTDHLIKTFFFREKFF